MEGLMTLKTCAGSLALAALLLTASRAEALPVPNKIVIVVEENTNLEEIIGNPDAPYLNALAAGGASFTNFYALTHPSQPNYLQLYSGANQGVLNNAVPAPGSPYTTANLGAELLAIGKTFAIYSEDLPEVGSTVTFNGKYVRRHNPVVNWQSDTPGPNQYGPQHNLPFTHFPTDFNQLPTFSFVVPNNDNNMHDGTIGEADTWLKDNLKSYADWAMINNSLLIVTWDEDALSSVNRIPTIFHGPMIQSGTQTPTWTLHNLLRTVSDMTGAGRAGQSKLVNPIVGPFRGDPQIVTTRLRQDVDGYAGTSDTYIESAAANTMHGIDVTVAVSATTTEGLIRFDGIFGNGLWQVPLGAKVLSAKLLLMTNETTPSNENMGLHAMLVNWSESSTWNSLGGGVSINDVEAESIAEFRVIPNVLNAPAIFDVSRSLQKWTLDPSKNHGWLLRDGSVADTWRWRSSEHMTIADHPLLEVTYERQHWGIDASGQWNAAANWISGLPAGPGAKANFLRKITAPRTIGISAPITIGSMTFDSDIGYTVAGAAITLESLPGVPTSIDSLAGAHTIVADVRLTDHTPINIAGTSRLDITGALTLAGGKTITKSGAGTLDAAGGISGAGTLVIQQGTVEARHFNGIVSRLSAGGRAVITPDGTAAATSKLLGLEFAGQSGDWKGQLDLINNALIIQSDNANRVAVLARIAEQIGFARNSGETLWTGTGLTSSSAAASAGIMGLGILLNDDGAGGPLYLTFAGQSADANSILVKFTLVGDLDLDGDVDADDYSRIDAGYATHSSGYWNGDLDYNGRINSDDFFAIDRAFSSPLNQQPGEIPAHAAVPEPAAMGSGLLLALTLSIRVARASRP
jgi:phosphatidylinositol-3-phosphatase